MYVVGDIHGRADLLEALIALIREDAALSRHEGRPVLAFLGDYVDRGPDSRRVLDLILQVEAEGAFGVGSLRGNHDQFLLDFLEDGRSGGSWMNYGGGATLLSYGVEPPAHRTDGPGWKQASEQLNQQMPEAHKDFLARTELIAVFGDYVLAHAGVRPGVALEEQEPDDLMGIRGPFLKHANPAPGRTVIFGHTPLDAPLLKGEKIGLDTGAYATGILTALKIFEGERGLLQTS